jgi:hypothetical protein
LSQNALPPPAAVQAALRKITETLAGELAQPGEVAPDWCDFEWRMARAVTTMHGISPLLATRLRWRGPSDWVQFLESQRMHTMHRHLRIEELLRLLDQRARANGIAAVALKGAALHAAGLYTAGERPMADVDLLVHPADSDGTARILQSLGFYESRVTPREREFSPVDHHSPEELGEHADNSIKVEIHGQIGETLPWYDTDISELVFPPRPHAGMNPYPSTASLMIHLLIHAAGAMTNRSLRLLQLHDLALLSLRMTDADWDELIGHKPTKRGYWWAFPPLQMTARYYPLHVPSRVLSALARECPTLLRRHYSNRKLSDVSWSYVWVDAFPGIEWSRSVSEMLSYAANRIRPSKEHIKFRELAAESDPSAAQGQWHRLSQSRRILRWMISRPTRSRTMHAVRVALTQTQ